MVFNLREREIKTKMHDASDLKGNVTEGHMETNRREQKRGWWMANMK